MDLCYGLKVDTVKVENLFSKYDDPMTVARNLGHDVENYDHLRLASRLLVRVERSRNPPNVATYVEAFDDLLSKEVQKFLLDHQVRLDALLESTDYLDYEYDWISANVFAKTYLSKSEKTINGIQYKESFRHMYLRVAVHLYLFDGIEEVVQSYTEMVHQYYLHATPTNLNAGKEKAQCSSCFLFSVKDNLKSLTKDGIHRAAKITKYNGGLGFSVDEVRHSEIKHGGNSQGLGPLLFLYNAMIRYVNQGGRRKGAATVYNRPHHIDIAEFCEMNQKTGDPYSRTQDLDLAIWSSWLFWKRVEENGDWSLFCPAKTKVLNDVWGLDFIREYQKCEADLSIPRKTIKAQQLFDIICRNQQMGGKLYTLNGDAANFKSNQKNLGIIRNSNLCTEIVEYSDKNEFASCNLAQISLSKMVVNGKLDYQLLAKFSRRLVQNLNRVIDRNWCPLKQIATSNRRHRPIGVGVSGFAEMLHQLDLPFEDPEVRKINKNIFACMYFNAVASSISEAILFGVYETFWGREATEEAPAMDGSPASKGKFQFDLWAEEYQLLKENGLLHKKKVLANGRVIPAVRKRKEDLPVDPSEWGQKEILLPNEDVILPTWEDLRRCMVKYGLRNSLLLAVMPTATSSIILRNCESVESHQTNIYSRKLQTGNYPVVNRFLVADLTEIGLWNKNTVHLIQADQGSISKLDVLLKESPHLFPDFNGNVERLLHVQKKYKTMWELPQNLFIKMAAERARYICQSQSTNLYFRYPEMGDLRKAQLYASRAGLKTYLYYLRQEPAVDPLKITIPSAILRFVEKLNESEGRTSPKPPSPTPNRQLKLSGPVCTDEVCTACQ